MENKKVIILSFLSRDIVAAIFWTKAICYPTSFIALFKTKKKEGVEEDEERRSHFRYGPRKNRLNQLKKKTTHTE